MKRTLCLVLLWLPAAVMGRSLGSLEFSPCTLTAEGTPGTVNAWCSTLQVPENRAEPAGRQISLSLAWVAPEAGDPEPDPVFLLAGGPGQSARQSYPAVEAAFADIASHRNVILLDQRGTGDSHLLSCEDDEEDFLDESDARLVQYTTACRDQLSADADLRFYTTREAVEDLEAVRQALGAPRINLVGVSYGTRVAQQYMKAYPTAVRSVVLDGVVPNTLVLGQDHAANLQATVDELFDRCRETEACKAQLGDPATLFARLRDELRETPRTVHYRDAITGEAKEGTFSYPLLAALLRMYVYQPQIASTLPLLLHELEAGHTDAAMAQAQMLLNSMKNSMAQGMGLSVSCTEDADELQEATTDAGTVMGQEFVHMIKTQCSVWPRGERVADFREPVRGDIPTLLLSGQFDPVTPPRYGNEVSSTLTRSLHLILIGQGHNVMGAGCTPKLMARFIETAGTQPLEVECLNRLRVVPPFSGHYGWEP